MILVFQDNGTMRVVESVEHANREYEAIDVENQEYTFLDDRGCMLKPVFRAPTKKKWLLFFSVADAGPFTFEPTSERKEELLRRLSSGEITLDPRSTPIRTLQELRLAAPKLLRS